MNIPKLFSWGWVSLEQGRKAANAPAVSKLSFFPSFPSQPSPSLPLHLTMCCCPGRFSCAPKDHLPLCCPVSPPYSPIQLPQKENPSLWAVMRLDLSISAACASPPAQPAHKEPLYSLPVPLLLPALAHVGQAVWQDWALPNNMGFFHSSCAVRSCFCSQLRRWEIKKKI